ncbi:hypothetical protein HPB50_028514 [Hyalomma asiaticum]|nr:hypothetical protein HPB50_028514 [Hyalomma asiaticum]
MDYSVEEETVTPEAPQGTDLKEIVSKTHEEMYRRERWEAAKRRALTVMQHLVPCYVDSLFGVLKGYVTGATLHALPEEPANVTRNTFDAMHKISLVQSHLSRFSRLGKQ